VRDEDVIICRCEDITLAEVRAALGEGFTDFEELKRLLRCTMGLCQGRTCRELILKEISSFRGVPPEQVEVPVHRPPTTPVRLRDLADAYRKRKKGDDHG